MDVKTRNQLALAMLVFAKVFGIAGLVLGATSYRPVGGAMLLFDGLLLLSAAALGLSNMREEKVAERDHKEILEQLMREGTLEQYLRDLRADAPEKERAPTPVISTLTLQASERFVPPLDSGTPAT